MSADGGRSDTKSPTKEHCKGCTWKGTSLRIHLNRTKLPCRKLYNAEDLKNKSDQLNKVKDAKRKYEKYHNNQNESQRKKAAAKEYYEKHKTEKTAETTKHDTKATEKLSQSPMCLICKETFVLEGSKKRHMEKFHSKVQKKIACDICEKHFEWKDNLSRHMREVHGGEKHGCMECPATYTRNEDLQEHIATGRHYLKFHCPICLQELVFKHLGGLIEHVVVKQSEGEQEYEGQVRSGFISRKWKIYKSGILLTCKSKLGSIQVEEGEHILGMPKSEKLEAYKKRMRKKEEVINFGLRAPSPSQEKPTVKLELIKITTHEEKAEKNYCKYCHMKTPFTNVYCKERAEKFSHSWELQRLSLAITED